MKNDQFTDSTAQLSVPAISVHLPDISRLLPGDFAGCVLELTRDCMRRMPDRLALSDCTRTWTYGELARSVQSVMSLLEENGLKPGDMVSVITGRNGTLPVSVIAVLEAGGRFCVVDPGYPSLRIAEMVKAGNPAVVLVSTETEERIRGLDLGCRIVCVSKLEEHESSPDECEFLSRPLRDTGAEAYILFTSGSTGRPKVIVNTLKPLSQFIDWHIREFGFSCEDRFSMISGLSHDPLLRDIFAPLACGGTVVIPANDVITHPAALLRWLEKNRVSVMHLTPPHVQILLMNEVLDPARLALRFLFFGGDQLSGALARDVKNRLPGVQMVNCYGATETPQIMSYCRVEKPYDGHVPIGRGREGCDVLVMDGDQVCAVGEPGEIVIRSPYLSKGYLGDREATAARFVVNSATNDPQDLLYRTGDMGLFNADGDVECLGRYDDQVKINGVRIELGEVAAALERHDKVRSVQVLARKDLGPELRLVAYVISRNGVLNHRELVTFLRERLPESMIPSVFVQLSEFPLNVNGKVDRKALPCPDGRGTQSSAACQPEVVSETEKMLCAIWADVLGVASVTASENFFELGGHSLLAVRLCTELERRMGHRLPLSLLFANPTVRGLANALDEQDREYDESSSVVTLQPGNGQLPLFFVHILGQGLKFCKPLVGCLGVRQPAYGLSVHFASGEQNVDNNVSALAAAYIRDMRRVQPQGPYQLVGVSFGGVVAWEMVRQLQEQGEKVRVLALLDTVAPGGIRRAGGARRMSGHWRNVKEQGLAYVLEKLRWQFRKVVAKARVLQFRLMRVYVQYLRRTGRPLSGKMRDIAARADNKEASSGYAPKPLMQDVLLFKCQNRTLGVSSELDPKLGWGSFVKGDVTVYNVPSDHLGMLEEPYVRVLADYLRPHLEDGPQVKTIGDDDAV